MKVYKNKRIDGTKRNYATNVANTSKVHFLIPRTFYNSNKRFE